MVDGIITKGIGGFYYVKTKYGVYECRARGLFREEKITPLVGDRVSIRVDENSHTGYIEKIYDRNSELIRPPVANVNQAVIVVSINKPKPNFWLLDRFLILAIHEGLDVVICINKIDLASTKEIECIENIYAKAGYKIIGTSCTKKEGIEELKEVLKDRISVFAGASGVGKSSLLNCVQEGLNLKTGEISKKNSRGKHTTRHIELLELGIGGLILDTPGFSSLDIDFIEKEEDLQFYYREILEESSHCRFDTCLHYKEPDCEVKRLVNKGEISKMRYNNYISFIEEIKNIRRY